MRPKPLSPVVEHRRIARDVACPKARKCKWELSLRPLQGFFGGEDPKPEVEADRTENRFHYALEFCVSLLMRLHEQQNVDRRMRSQLEPAIFSQCNPCAFPKRVHSVAEWT